MKQQRLMEGLVVVVLLSFSLLGGCAGRGDIISVHLPIKPKAGELAKAGLTGPQVAVVPFEDSRSDRTKLGTRNSIWGGESYFNVPSSNPGEDTAQALAEYLKQRGWRAQYMKTPPSGDGAGPDVIITGKIVDLSVNAKGGFGFTELVAKNKLSIQAKNQEDGSSITDTVNHAGTYNVMWFEPQDGEDILTDVLEKNFERFVVNTKFDGRSLRFR